MHIFLLIIRIVFLNDTNTITINSKPSKENKVSFTNKRIYKPSYSFFENQLKAKWGFLYASYTPDKKLVCFDTGNLEIVVFNDKGETVNIFGNEGVNPGEFKKNWIWDIHATQNKIYTHQWNKVMIFDYSGNLISEIKGRKYFQKSKLQVGEKEVTALFHNNANRRFLKVEFDETGKLIKEYKNSAFVKSQKEKTLREQIIEMLSYPITRVQYRGQYIEPDLTDYKIYFYSEDREIIKTLYKPYKRQKYIVEDMWYSKIKGLDKKRQKRFKIQKEVYESLHNGYYPSIASILGIYKDYLFVHTYTNNNTVTIDIISTDGVYDSRFIRPANEPVRVKLSNGKLMFSYKEREKGPYVETYDIKIN